VFGHTHTERGLTCKFLIPFYVLLSLTCVIDVEFFYSGHMTPRK
jgi:hypothetical protein